MPPGRWPAPAAEAPRAPAPAVAGFELAALVARLSSGGRTAGGPSGRAVVVMETRVVPDAEGLPVALSRALADGSSLLAVDLNGPAGHPDQPGFSDLVAGEAVFLDAIQADRGTGLHRIGAGHIDGAVLFEEPRALALTVEAMAEAYDWVVLRLRPAADAADLLALVSACADGVVIASNAAAEDPELADLYAIAEDAGAGQVLIARDRPASHAALPEETAPELRLSAA
jgi:polysaccharide biosynthesis transport protein